MQKRESVGRASTRSQSASGPPVMQMVSVAVLPPRLPPGLAPGQGAGAAGAFDWDQMVNWQHNETLPKGPAAERKRSFWEKAGITTARKRRNPDLPPFMMRQVPYETWRKHYAKDKDGNYHGTHAPAEDCLLKPEDVKKWRVSEMVTYGDKWTRGKEALPVYAEVRAQETVPEYEKGSSPSDEPIVMAEIDWKH